MQPVTLDQVDRQIATGTRWLRFQPAVEAAYSREFAAQRVRLAPVWAIVGTLIYDMVFFGDATMVGDRMHELMIARFGIFTPFAIIATLAIRRWPSARNYDILSLSVVLLGGTLPMAAAMSSNSPHLFIYQNGNVATFLFLVIGLRPRFHATLLGLVLLCWVHLTISSFIPSFDATTYQGLVTFYITISIFLALGAYFQEHADRMNFLNRLRASLLHDQLQQQSERDELTGLLNRRSLVRHSQVLRQPAGGRACVHAVMLDIDHFKLFNDVHGHIEGDACIRVVSGCIAQVVGHDGIAFRFGGEEMLVLLPKADMDQALTIAETIRSAIESKAIPHRGLGCSGVVTASLGVAGGASEFDLEDLLKQADGALYQAKRLGRNRVCTPAVMAQQFG